MGRVAGEPEAGRGHWVQAVRVDDVETSPSLARAPGPARAAGRVARGQVRGDRGVAHAQGLTVGDDLHALQGREAIRVLAEAVLGVVGGRLAALERARP